MNEDLAEQTAVMEAKLKMANELKGMEIRRQGGTRRREVALENARIFRTYAIGAGALVTAFAAVASRLI